MTELEPLREDGWLVDVLHAVKSGKEATVYCCAAGPRVAAELVAAKVYHQRTHRSFKNDSIYQEGRVVLDRRLQRAVRRRTRTGRACQFSSWISTEYEALEMLHESGADVPKPYVCSGDAILMEYVGDAEMAAPPLRQVQISPDEARPLFECLMDNITLWLSRNCVHGDLSPFNILYWQGRLKVIDFPQSVDPRFNPNAFSLLRRDVENVCAYFRRYGGPSDSDRIAHGMWTRFRRAQL